MHIENPDQHVSELRESGITVIEGCLGDEMAEDLYGQVINSLESNEFADGDDFDGYGKLASAGEPVVNERTGTSEGIIDTFDMDLAIDEVAEIENSQQLNRIVSEAAGVQFVPTNINTHVRRSVTNSAHYHADSYTKYKSFIHLSDVFDTSLWTVLVRRRFARRLTCGKVWDGVLDRHKGNTSAPRAIVPEPTEAKHATAPKGT